MNAELSDVCDRLLASVLNGVGQGLLLVLFVAAILQLWRKANAATRHAVELATLLILAVLPITHFFLDGSHHFSFGTAPFADLSEPVVETPALTLTAREEFPLSFAETAPSPVPIPVEESPAEVIAGEKNSPWTFSLPAYGSAILLGAWFLISGFRLASLVVQIFLLRALKRESVNASDATRELFSKLCVELEVSRAPQLRIAPRIHAPMAVGFKEPAVLLPDNLGVDAHDLRLEQILRHELAHVIRRDDWANLFQQTVRALFFFHPGVIWASRRLTLDREIACDDHVLEARPDRKTYALSLAEFASRGHGRALIAAPAAWSQQSHLKQRINMILDTQRNSAPRLARGKTSLFAVAALMVATLAFQAIPRLALAESAPEVPPAEPAINAPVQAEVSVTASPDVQVRVKPMVAPAPPRAPRPAKVIVAPGALYAAAGDEASEDASADGAPRAKVRFRNNQDGLERRLDRLERLVETLVRRDAEQKAFQFSFKDKPGMGNFNFNHDEFAKLNEKAMKDAEKAVKDLEKHGKLEHFSPGPDGVKIQRKVLESQKQSLERQMQSLERQIEKLEHEQHRMEQDREREEARRERDEKRREEKERDEEGVREKDAPKPAPTP